MGAAAILLGVLLGMLLSQIISVIVVQSFGENYHLHLSLFPDTFLGTVIFLVRLYFCWELRTCLLYEN